MAYISGGKLLLSFSAGIITYISDFVAKSEEKKAEGEEEERDDEEVGGNWGAWEEGDGDAIAGHRGIGGGAQFNHVWVEASTSKLLGTVKYHLPFPITL